MNPVKQAVHPFEPEGVSIVTPIGFQVVPKDVVKFWQAPIPPHIEWMRSVFAFDLLRGGEKVTKGTAFDPPLEIHVSWTKADGKIAGKKGKLPTLMIDWEDGAGWQEPQPPSVRYDPPGHHAKGGVAHLVIETWLGEDPRIGWAD